MIKLAIFASGTGSNSDKLIKYFNSSASGIVVAAVVSNNPNAKVLEKAANAGVKTAVFSNEVFLTGTEVIRYLKSEKIEWIVLAGFLRRIPEEMIREFPDRIINIHPSLLPKYGGKGMYGSRVHEAVVEAGEMESGISIHLVNENYDEGRLLFQKSFTIESTDSAIDVAKKVQQLEHQYFPKVVEDTIKMIGNEN